MTRPPTDTDWRSRADILADRLRREGAIRTPAWRAVFADVPRHAFVPRWWALDEYNRIDHPVSGEDPAQQAEWLDGIYTDQPLVTQWADGEYAGHPVRVPTSSASQPSVVATMLDRLDVRAGHRVLEIGTGTGFNAALLCNRLGDDLVHSIDIHPDLVGTARDRLDTCGYRPHLHVGDGADPPATDGDYDRIIATCAVPGIPTAWLDRLAPGGRVVAPLTIAGALAVLDRHDDGALHGHIDLYQVHFMPLRSSAAEATTAGTAPVPPEPDPATTEHGRTDVDPAVLADPDFRLWLALHDPDLVATTPMPGPDPASAHVYTNTVSATVVPDDDGWAVGQDGGRPWDTVETAWRTFLRHGRPDRGRIALTVHPHGAGQFFSLVDDDTTWPLPAPALREPAGPGPL